jgi:hypothetical protein
MTPVIHPPALDKGSHRKRSRHRKATPLILACRKQHTQHVRLVGKYGRYSVPLSAASRAFCVNLSTIVDRSRLYARAVVLPEYSLITPGMPRTWSLSLCVIRTRRSRTTLRRCRQSMVATESELSITRASRCCASSAGNTTTVELPCPTSRK